MKLHRNQVVSALTTALVATSADGWVLQQSRPNRAINTSNTINSINTNRLQPDARTGARSSLGNAFRNAAPNGPRSMHGSTSTRLYSSDESSGRKALRKVKNTVKSTAKSLLPKSWFQSEEEKKAELARKQMKKEFSNEINQALANAPLALRMLGKMVSPMMSKMASSLAQTVAEQQRSAQQVLDDANRYLVADPAVTRVLGEPLRVGNPISQSSSSTNINGNAQSRVELGVPVVGTIGSGVARILSVNGKIENIRLEVNGQIIDVALVSTPTAGGRQRINKFRDDDNIIEAEIIDKKTTK